MKTWVQFPDVFLPDGELNRFLVKYKSSLAKRWTLTRMEGLFEEVDLAYYLTALQRESEALKALKFLTETVVFDGNYNRWTPIGYALCLQARIYRMSNQAQAAQEALNMIRSHAFRAVVPNDVPLELMKLETQLAAIDQEKSTKWACHNLSRVLYKFCFFRETGQGTGFPHSDLYDTKTVDIHVETGLIKLRELLQRS